jgi:DNA repair exonuclease SbcCD ATPase subunit
VAGADEAIDGLYGLPLEEFTRARNELTKRLRGEGDGAAAAEVAKLRKPSRPAWAINRVARDRPELAEAVLDAAAGLAAAQEAVVSGSGREALDDAVRAEREAVEELVAAARAELELAGSGSAAMIDRARRTLHAVAGDPELQAELGAARIVADREPVGFGAAPAASPAAGRRAAAKRSGRKESHGKAAEEERQSRAQLAEARGRVQAAERRFGKRERDLERSLERLETARQGVATAEEEVAELAEDLQRRRKELEDAKAVLAELS